MSSFAAPSDNLASQDRHLGIWIGVPVAAGLLLLVALILYCLRKAKNSRSLRAGGGEPVQRTLGHISHWGNGEGHLLGEGEGLRGPEAMRGGLFCWLTL